MLFRRFLQTNHNILLATDVYKMGHAEQYVPGISKVYSYLQARSDKNFQASVFFGLQYYLKEYLTKPITHAHVDEFLKVRNDILGPTSTTVETKFRQLADLGHWPLLIKAVPEGSVVPVKNVLMTMTNTKPEFYWTVGFVESLLLKTWYPTTVATASYHYRNVAEKYFASTSVNKDLIPFLVHDFGYRGDTSEESSMISGMAHLTSFTGSDTVPAYQGLINYYKGTPGNLFHSVPASEHSVMCSFGRAHELDAFRNMLRIYPTGIVSIVSDTYNIWNVMTQFTRELYDEIMNREGKVVFRPDSGNPEYIICGDPNADPNTPEGKGCVRLLNEVFGSTVNSKGYKELNPKIGLIYGDGMHLERYERTLKRLKEQGYASSNLIIGVGSILRFYSRDSLGFALKATKITVHGVEQSIMKDPITDQRKKSHKGYLSLIYDDGEYKTLDDVSSEQEKGGELKPVYRDGKLLIDQSIDGIRERVRVQGMNYHDAVLSRALAQGMTSGA